MATILTKKSDTASSVPTAGALTNSTGGAEIAVNTADKRLFTKDSGGTVVELGTNPSSLSLPNGTANAVPYLNGSKVLTSGSALTFDGSNLGTSTSGSTGLTMTSSASQAFINLRSVATAGFEPFIGFGDVSAGNIAQMLGVSGGGVRWTVAGSEQMRLTSTGLGIGTSSPAYKLDALSANANSVHWKQTGTANGDGFLYSDNNGSGIFDTAGGSGNGMYFYKTGNAIWWNTNATERMRLDSSGNLGLGVTPSAWVSGWRAFDIGSGGNIYSNGASNVALSANAYNIDGAGGWRYKGSGNANLFQTSGGQFLWYTAPSGTAGTAISFTQAMTLDANGALTVIKDGSFQGVTVGRGAGAVSTNTAVGASALAANTTGDNSVGIGYGALQSNTSGPRNIAVGRAALNANTTNGDNTAVGHASLQSSTGSANTAFGSQSLASNTTASNNTAVGYQAGYSNTTGSYAVALGFQALYGNTTANSNVAVGYQAAVSNTTGYEVTAVGHRAGAATGTVRGNTMFGAFAGEGTTGGFNTFIGGDAGYQVTTGSKNTILGRYNGNQGGLDIRTSSNYIVLSDGDGNPRAFHNGSNGVWNLSGGIKCAQVTIAHASTGTVTVPNGCICTMSGDGYFDDGLMFTLKSQGGSQGCYVMARGGSAGSWGVGTTSNPSSGSRGNLWISAGNTLSIQNLAGSTITFYLTFLSAS